MLLVPFTVPRQLLIPILYIRSWPIPTSTAIVPMPIAAVNKDHFASSWED
jgi:hypothetical protein